MARPFKPAAEVTSGNTYVWVGPQNATWAAPADWLQSNTGAVGKSAPHAGDAVIITGGTLYGQYVSITGGGAAGDVTLNGPVYLAGAYRFGTLHVLGSLNLTGSLVVPQAAAADLYISGGTVDVRDELLVTGQLSIGEYEPAADVEVGRLDLRVGRYAYAPTVSVGTGSTLEIGHAGGAAAGVVTVDGGATLSGGGSIANGVVDNGVVVAQGSLSLQALTGAGTLRIAAYSEAAIWTAGAGTTIDFAGPGSVLALSPQNFTSNAIGAGTTIEGFEAGDVIRFDDANITAVSRSVSGGVTTVTLLNSEGGVEQQLAFAGDESNVDFVLLDGFPSADVALLAVPAGAATAPPAPGVQGGPFVWTGASRTDWNTATDWREFGQGGSVGVPGSLDLVTIRGAAHGLTTLTGSGDAARVDVSGTVDFSGTFKFGALQSPLALHTYTSVVLIGPGASISSQRVALLGAALTIADGATMQVATLGGGFVDLVSGSTLQVTGVAEGTLVQIDATSVVDIGGTGGAAGVVTIAAGGLAEDLSDTTGTIVDEGRLVVRAAGSDIRNISGGGEVVLSGGTLAIEQSIAGVQVDFSGRYNRLELSDVTIASGLQVSGLAITDSIELSDYGRTLNGLRYIPQGSDGGTLDVLGSDGSVFASFDIVGKYRPDTFLLTQDSYYDYDTITVLPTNFDHQVSAGSADGETFQLKGASGPESWSDAANWALGPGGTSTDIAPGAKDTAIFGYAAVPSFVTGAANVATLEVEAGVTLDGSFVARIATLDTLDLVGAATTLQVGSGYGSEIVVDRARFLIGSGTLGDVQLRDGGFLSAQSLDIAGLFVDSTSRAVLGQSGGEPSALAGALTVQAGNTLQGSGLLQAAMVDDGVVAVATSIEVTGPVTGSGTFVVGSSGPDATLKLDGNVSATTQIDFVAGQSSVVYGTGGGAHGEVHGFTVGDQLVFNGVVGSLVAFDATGASGGSLLIQDQNSQTVASVQLLGNYRGASFAISPGPFSTNTVTLTSFHST